MKPFSTPETIHDFVVGLETNVEKADALSQQTEGNDQAQMQGYQDRSKYREVIGTKYARELVLK
jgi:hypothetical protein